MHYKNYYVKPNSCEMSLAFLLLGQDPVFRMEFFVFRKMEMPETQNPPAMRVESNRYTEKHLSVTIELFSHYRKKGKVIL